MQNAKKIKSVQFLEMKILAVLKEKWLYKLGNYRARAHYKGFTRAEKNVKKNK